MQNIERESVGRRVSTIVHALWDVVDYADLVLDLRERREEFESQFSPRRLVLIERSLFIAIVTAYGQVFARGASSGSKDFAGIAGPQPHNTKPSNKPSSQENASDCFMRAEIDRISAIEINGVSNASVRALQGKLLKLRNQHVAHADGSVMTHWTERPHEGIGIELNYISDPVDSRQLGVEDLRLLKCILEQQIGAFEALQRTIQTGS